jgi:hypothetical protein
MIGAIRNRDVLLHPVVTIRSFGWRVFLRAAVAGRNRTFLSTLQEAGFFQDATPVEPDLVERCIQLELRAMRLYELLAHQFAGTAAISGFLEDLADQEQCHAELLQLCRAAQGPRRWQTHSFQAWRECVPRLEERMQQAWGSAESIRTVDELARLLFEIEASEMNNIMGQIIETSDSAFVKKLAAFQYALTDHIDFICQHIQQFASNSVPDCQQLRAKLGKAQPAQAR